MDELDLKQRDLRQAGGPSPATVRALFSAAEAGEDFKDLQIGTLRKIDNAMRWEQGSTRDVMAGGQPRPLPNTGPDAVAVVRGIDPEIGEVVLAVPAEALAALDPIQRAEVEHHLVAEFLKKYREFQATQPAQPPAQG